MKKYNAITDVPGILVGHYSKRATGTTVILVEGVGAIGGVSVAGAAPGTRDTGDGSAAVGEPSGEGQWNSPQRGECLRLGGRRWSNAVS